MAALTIHILDTKTTTTTTIQTIHVWVYWKTLNTKWCEIHEKWKKEASVCTFVSVCVIKYPLSAGVFTQTVRAYSQQSELISLLLQPHLQQALDRPTTTSRPLRSALRRASRISSVMKERADLLNTPSWLSLGVKLRSLFLWRRLSTTELWLKPSEDSSWWELNGSSEKSDAIKWASDALENSHVNDLWCH